MDEQRTDGEGGRITPARRRFRFSLKELFAIGAIIAACASCYLIGRNHGTAIGWNQGFGKAREFWEPLVVDLQSRLRDMNNRRYKAEAKITELTNPEAEKN
jgi:hypothetical protein